MLQTAMIVFVANVISWFYDGPMERSMESFPVGRPALVGRLEIDLYYKS